jgi:formiminoglutamase
MFESLTESSSVLSTLYESFFGEIVRLPLDFNSLSNKPIIGLLGADKNADLVRAELFKLSNQLNECEILDFGNLKEGQEMQLPFLFEDLLSKNILPILISPSKANVIYHFHSLLKVQAFNTVMMVHPSLKEAPEIKEIIEQGLKDGLLKLKYIGHQAHVTAIESLNQIQESGIEAMRLGHIRQNIDRVEPWCRSLDHAIFHLDALRKTDFPAKESTNPGGFYYEEACKISQFLGASSHLKSIGFYGYNATVDKDLSSAAVIAQLIWYFIDGFIHFREDASIQKSKLIQYTVHASHSELDINFWKSNESGRWWMEVPGQPDHWVSCTYDDYLEASHGEFSTRLINVLNRG